MYPTDPTILTMYLLLLLCIYVKTWNFILCTCFLDLSVIVIQNRSSNLEPDLIRLISTIILCFSNIWIMLAILR